MEFSKALRKAEKFISYFLTAGERRCAPCDSHIHLCHACFTIRRRLHGVKQPVHWINTKHAIYFFQKNRLTTKVPRFRRPSTPWEKLWNTLYTSKTFRLFNIVLGDW